MQGAPRNAAHLARPQNKDAGAGKVPENLFRQLHCHGSHGGCPGMNLAFRPHFFTDSKGFLKGFVGAGRSYPGIQGRLVSRFYLAEDFRFPQHHGIQAAQHAAQMA